MKGKKYMNNDKKKLSSVQSRKIKYNDKEIVLDVDKKNQQIPINIEIEQVKQNVNSIKEESSINNYNAKVCKKYNLKKKFLASIKLFNDFENLNLKLSKTFLFFIKEKKEYDPFFYMDRNDQITFFKIAASLNKSELLLLLFFINAKTDQIKYLKENILTTKIVNSMFKKLDYNLIELDIEY